MDLASSSLIVCVGIPVDNTVSNPNKAIQQWLEIMNVNSEVLGGLSHVQTLPRVVSRDVVSTSYSEQGTLSLLKGINPTVQGRKVLHPCDDAVKFQVEINGALSPFSEGHRVADTS